MSIIDDTLGLGIVLNGLSDRVQAAISQAENAGQFTMMQAGAELNTTIANVQAAYKDMLDSSLKTLDQSVRSTIAQLDTMTTQLEDKAIASLDNFTHQAQQIVNTLPFRNSDPQVTSFLPKYVVPSGTAASITFAISGNFVLAEKPDFKPYVKVGGQRYEAATATTQKLEFVIPLNVLVAGGKTGFSHAEINLVVPYEAAPGCSVAAIASLPFLSALVKTKVEGSFALLIGILPPSPGTIQFQYQVTQNTDERHHIGTSPAWYQASDSDDIPDNPQTYAIRYPYQDTNYPYPQWNVVPGTLRFARDWVQGKCQQDPGNSEDYDWRYEFITDNPVTFGVATIHHGSGTSGKVKFHYEFDVHRQVTNVNWQGTSVTLGWGESKSFNYKTGTWKVTFVDFNGRHNEYMSNNLDGPILIVKDNGSNVSLEVPAPENIKW